MLLQELLPRGLPLSLWGRLDAVPRQDVCNRAAANLMTQIGKRTLDSSITPAAILTGEAHDQSFNLFGLPGSAWAALITPIVFQRNESTMPGQQGFRLDDRTQFDQDLPSQA